MSRIRSIKPEFWSNEQLASCSRDARLMFIGLWNFCDDCGRMEARALQIKMRLFPADSLSPQDVSGFLQELSGVGLIDLYEVNGVPLLWITGWHHQLISHPSEPKYPDKSGVYSKFLNGAKNCKPTDDSGSHPEHSESPPPHARADRSREGGRDRPIPTDRDLSTRMLRASPRPLERRASAQAEEKPRKARDQPLKAGNGALSDGSHEPSDDSSQLTKTEFAKRAKELRRLATEIAAAGAIAAMSDSENGVDLVAAGPEPGLDEAKLAAYRDKPVQFSPAAKQTFGARVPTQT